MTEPIVTAAELAFLLWVFVTLGLIGCAGVVLHAAYRARRDRLWERGARR